MLNEDAMTTEKLAEGIRKFSADIVTLEKYAASCGGLSFHVLLSVDQKIL